MTAQVNICQLQPQIMHDRHKAWRMSMCKLVQASAGYAWRFQQNQTPTCALTGCEGLGIVALHLICPSPPPRVEQATFS